MNNWGIHADWWCQGVIQQGMSRPKLERYLREHTLRNNHFMSLPDYLGLIDYCASQMNDDHLGIHVMSQNKQAQDTGLFSYLLRNAATLGDLCDVLQRYQGILMRGMYFSLQHRGETSSLCYEILYPFSNAVRHDVELSITSLLMVFNNVLGRFCATRVNFCHQQVGSLAAYREVFGASVHFNQPVNSFEFDAKFLTHPVSHADPKLLKILQQQADAILLETGDDFAKQVEFYITAGLGNDNFNQQYLCQQLNITSRTLHRRLQGYHQTYKGLKQNIILKLAKNALINTDASITEIAQQLRYSEASAFVRAFKKQCSLSPLQYRKKYCVA